MALTSISVRDFAWTSSIAPAIRWSRSPRRARAGDTFILDSGGTRHLFLFSPAGVRAFSLSAIARTVRRLVETYELDAWFTVVTPYPNQIGGVARAAEACPVAYRRLPATSRTS
jgi:hypothetical protein